MEWDAVQPHDEINHAARRPAAKAVKEVLGRGDVEGRAGLLVEGTQGHKVPPLFNQLQAPRPRHRRQVAFPF